VPHVVLGDAKLWVHWLSDIADSRALNKIRSKQVQVSNRRSENDVREHHA
jgi:hypothetical protein